MDLQILIYIQEHMKSNVFDLIMPWISFLSDAGWIWMLTAVILCFTKKYRTYGYALFIGLILCMLFGNVTLKPLIGRLRPYDVNNSFDLIVNKLSDFSFPSGHTYSAFCGATILFYVNRKIGYAALILAVLTAFSRLYLFVHYPSDVLAGAFMGIVLALFALYCVKLFKRHLDTRKLDSISQSSKTL